MYSVNLLEWDGQGKIANCTSNLPIIGPCWVFPLEGVAEDREAGWSEEGDFPTPSI